MEKKEEKKFAYVKNLNIFIFLIGIAAAISGFSLLKEDVMSSAYTLLDYFPREFKVKPVSDLTGGIAVGLFFTFTQIAGLFAAMTKEFNIKVRWTGAILFVLFMLIDNWTDIVYRSQYLSGDLVVSVLVTGTIYTVGSEFSSGVAVALVSSFWRSALSEFLMFFAILKNKASSLGRDWKRYDEAARRMEQRQENEERTRLGQDGRPLVSSDNQSRPNNNDNRNVGSDRKPYSEKRPNLNVPSRMPEPMMARGNGERYQNPSNGRPNQNRPDNQHHRRIEPPSQSRPPKMMGSGEPRYSERDTGFRPERYDYGEDSEE